MVTKLEMFRHGVRCVYIFSTFVITTQLTQSQLCKNNTHAIKLHKMIDDRTKQGFQRIASKTTV